MRPVIEGTKARELAGTELQIMEEAHELAGQVLERHSGDFSQAAEELWPYEIAQTALRCLSSYRRTIEHQGPREW